MYQTNNFMLLSQIHLFKSLEVKFRTKENSRTRSPPSSSPPFTPHSLLTYKFWKPRPKSNRRETKSLADHAGTFRPPHTAKVGATASAYFCARDPSVLTFFSAMRACVRSNRGQCNFTPGATSIGVPSVLSRAVQSLGSIEILRARVRRRRKYIFLFRFFINGLAREA